MKFTYPLFLLLILFSCKNSSKYESKSQTNQSDIDSIHGLISDSFQDIWSDLDSTKINKYYTADFILLENGVVWNNDSVRNYVKAENKRMDEQQYRRINRFDFIKTVQNHSSIWVAYDNYGTWVKGNDTLGKAHWLESAVAVKENNKWKIQQLHSTRVRN